MTAQQTFTQILELIHQGKHLKARALCKKWLHAQPKSFHGHLLLGVALLNSQEPQKAINAFRESLTCSQAPKLLAQAHNNMAACYIQLNQGEQAKHSALSAIANQAQVLDYHLNLIAAYDQLKRWSAMKAASLTVIKHWPNCPDGYLSAAIATRNLGDFDQAHTYLSTPWPILAELTHKLTDTTGNLPHVDALYEWLLVQSCQKTQLDVSQLINRLYPLYQQTTQLTKQAFCRHIADYIAEEGQPKLARNWYTLALQLDPSDSYCEHMINASIGQCSHRAPSAYVSALYNKHANAFEQRLVNGLGYHAHTLLSQTLVDLGISKLSQLLDLGCGTGLLGKAISQQIAIDHLVGQDLSAAMLEHADKKSCYSTLHEGDVLSPWPIAPHAKTNGWDAICATDVFIYIGDLTHTFEQARKTLAPNGIFAFTTEQLPNTAEQPNSDYILTPSGRYQHKTQTVLEQASQYGFNLTLHQAFDLRLEHQEQLTGDLFIFTLAP